MKRFIDKHKGKNIIVCGCGESALQMLDIQNQITIGVNDIDRLFSPTYLLVVNPPSSFNKTKQDSIINTSAEYVFTQYKNHWNIEDKKVLIHLGSAGLSNLDNPLKIDYSKDSTYMAVILAYRMGATNIGLIGVDFTPNHFYDKDGVHILVQRNYLSLISKNYAKLHSELQKREVNLFNLNKQSAIESIPKMALCEFIEL